MLTVSLVLAGVTTRCADNDYTHQITSDAADYSRLAQVCVMGSGGVGKSTITVRFVHDWFGEPCSSRHVFFPQLT